MPFLTIILCTYNRADHLRVTIDSLLRQEAVADKNHWELLIVDNNSNDHTRDVIESYVATSPINIRYLFEPQPGKSHALNAGIANASGEVLGFTDDDVIVTNDWVASILEASAKYPHKVFGGKVLPQWPKSIPPWIHQTGPYAKPIVGAPIVSHDWGDESKEYREGMWVPIGSNMFVRREVFETYGGFRTDLGPRPGLNGHTHEDSEWGFRIMNRGEKILYYPKAVIYHPIGEDRLSQEFLLKFFWNLGVSYAKIEFDELTFTQRSKTIVRSVLSCATRFGTYLLTLGRRHPAMTMHHKCLLYHQSGALYYQFVSAMTAALFAGRKVTPS